MVLSWNNIKITYHNVFQLFLQNRRNIASWLLNNSFFSLSLVGNIITLLAEIDTIVEKFTKQNKLGMVKQNQTKFTYKNIL